MGYLDNSSITVDAVLTKKGREILKNGGNLNISSFTMSDTGVDYTLWNPDHPSGSAFYGEAIENLPQLEASVHAEYNLRNRLVSLNQNTVAIPALQIAGTDGKGLTTLTLEEGRLSSRITLDLVGYTSTRSNVNNPYYIVIQDPSLVTISGGQLKSTLSGTSRIFLEEQDIPFAQEFSISGTTFNIRASQQDTKGKQTNVYMVHQETGAYNSLTVVNNVTRDKRAILATNIQN
tara:strand:+ start:605 stop:1303 length:699 start_codon:yes stop_codon:yes gene_type:complete